MDIKVPYQNLSTKEEAFIAVQKIITPETMERFKVKADVDVDEVGKMIHAKGSGFKLDLEFMDEEVGISLDLSFMLKPFKNKVLETIKNMVTKTV